jgi:aspartyl-tRNA(Asn)/glutamyl-tRNA(Gln) amidotransferase subunit A
VSIWITEVEAPSGDGPTLAVKDIFETAGVRSTYGSAIFRDHIPDTTAASVRLLQDAGYRMVGKANLHEFAWGITSENDHYGWVPNPAAPGRVAGGSSGGSAAALAAGLVDAALGSDSGGSIRIPAACCGVVGLKVSFGAVPIDGCWPLAPSYDTAGPMARDVAGCERMMEAMAPGFTRAETALEDLRVGIAWTDLADPLVAQRVREAAAHFPSARPIELALPAGVYTGFAREVVEVHRDLFRDHEDLYGPSVAFKMRTALKITDAEAEEGRRLRELYKERVAQLMEDVDLIVAPAIPWVAQPAGVGDLELRGRMLSLTFPWNATGGPALALPCGPAEDGLPASVQIMGRPGEDALVLAAGRLLESELQTRYASSR